MKMKKAVINSLFGILLGGSVQLFHLSQPVIGDIIVYSEQNTGLRDKEIYFIPSAKQDVKLKQWAVNDSIYLYEYSPACSENLAPPPRLQLKKNTRGQDAKIKWILLSSDFRCENQLDDMVHNAHQMGYDAIIIFPFSDTKAVKDTVFQQLQNPDDSKINVYFVTAEDGLRLKRFSYPFVKSLHENGGEIRYQIRFERDPKQFEETAKRQSKKWEQARPKVIYVKPENTDYKNNNYDSAYTTVAIVLCQILYYVPIQILLIPIRMLVNVARTCGLVNIIYRIYHKIRVTPDIFGHVAVLACKFFKLISLPLVMSVTFWGIVTCFKYTSKLQDVAISILVGIGVAMLMMAENVGNNNFICAICMERVVSVAFTQCGHVSCELCHNKMLHVRLQQHLKNSLDYPTPDPGCHQCRAPIIGNSIRLHLPG